MGKGKERNNDAEIWCWTGIKGIEVKSLLKDGKADSLAVGVFYAHSKYYSLLKKNKTKRNKKLVLLAEMIGYYSGTGEFQSKVKYLIVQESKKILPD